MSVITKDLGAVTAYAAAVNRGYTGTKEEFETLMASYATVAQQAAESAQSASSSAQGAFQAASSANTAMNNTRIAESNAQSAASGAQGYAQYAQQSAQSASRSATDAESAKQTAVDAVDGFAAGAQQALDGVNQAGNNWKSLAQAQKLDSEAWAVGQRDGEDVGSSDPAYHNNAKYYAESISASAQTASDAAQTATIKASEAQASAEAAAESARTLTIDATLTQAGQAADAKETGDKISALKEDLSIIEKSVKYPYTDGKFIDVYGRLVSNEQYAFTAFIPCDTGTKICLVDIRTGSSVLAYAFYSEKDENSFISGQNNLIGGVYNITIPSNAKYVRFSSRTTDGGTNTWNPQAYVYNSLAITKKVETVQDDVSEIETDVSELQSNVSNISEKISAITPEDTTFFDIYDFIKTSFVEYVSGIVGTDGKYYDRDNFALTSIEIKVEPNTTYVLEIPGADRNTGTSNDTGIFESSTAYNTLTVTRSGDYLTFTTGSGVSYAVIYFYSGTYDMSHGIEGIHLYKDSAKTNTTPTVKLENLPASVKGNAEPLNILIFGDSISDTINFTIDSETDTTTAYSVKVPNNSYTNGQGQIIQYEMWPTLIQRVLNVAELRNYAKAGAHFYTTSRTPADPRQKLLYQVEVAFNDLTNPNGVFPSNDFEPDIVIVACGINDGNIASGSFETTMAKTVMNQAETGVDVEATMNAMNQQNPMDAMRYVLMKIKQRFPTALLLYINPLQQTYNTNERRLTAREQLRKMAEQYGFINLDGFGEFGVVRDFEAQNEVGLLTKDGLHPNDKGQNLYARNIVQAIKRYYFPLDSFNP